MTRIDDYRDRLMYECARDLALKRLAALDLQALGGEPWTSLSVLQSGYDILKRSGNIDGASEFYSAINATWHWYKTMKQYNAEDDLPVFYESYWFKNI